jgi:DNA primase
MDLDQIKSDHRIEDVVSSYITLKAISGGFVALCPFHQEKTPSFNVTPSTGRFMCFGCNKSGDVFDFVQEMEGISLSEAAKKLGGTQEFTPDPTIKATKQERASIRKARPVFPELSVPTDYHLRRICETRSLEEESVEAAVAAGMLWSCTGKHGDSCWMLTDKSRIAGQIRKIDNSRFGERKALTIPKSWAKWPIGLANIPDGTERIIICEGGPDVLAAFQAITDNSHPVAMIGSSFEILPAALPYFIGKRVTIVPHNDTAGLDAYDRWAAQLLPNARSVDACHLDDQAGDLNDAVKLDPTFVIL